MEPDRRCGRPTRSGTPCRNPLFGHDLACATHATEQDRALADAYRKGYSEGLRQGYDMGKSGATSEIDRLTRRVQDLQRQAEENARYYERDGDQVVEVGGYGYRWSGSPPLEVGERVLLPENWLSAVQRGHGPFEGVVTALGSTYEGPLSRILRRAPG